MIDAPDVLQGRAAGRTLEALDVEVFVLYPHEHTSEITMAIEHNNKTMRCRYKAWCCTRNLGQEHLGMLDHDLCRYLRLFDNTECKGTIQRQCYRLAVISKYVGKDEDCEGDEELRLSHAWVMEGLLNTSWIIFIPNKDATFFEVHTSYNHSGSERKKTHRRKK